MCHLLFGCHTLQMTPLQWIFTRGLEPSRHSLQTGRFANFPSTSKNHALDLALPRLVDTGSCGFSADGFLMKVLQLEIDGADLAEGDVSAAPAVAVLDSGGPVFCWASRIDGRARS